MITARLLVAVPLCVLFLASALPAQTSFVNWENPHVHPLDRTPDGSKLLAVNTAAACLEVFTVDGNTLLHSSSIPVGLDPISVRARSNSEAWVVNVISDSVSIVDLDLGVVTYTLDTADEPADVVFAGDPARAFVSCSQVNEILVFDLDDLTAAPEVISIFGEEPRALAVSPSGDKVFAAIFESGNGSTSVGGNPVVSGGAGSGDAFPPDAVSDFYGPYLGVNPPPNSGDEFLPAQNSENTDPPLSSLIVKKNADGVWQDDNGGDWTEMVTGSLAARSGRPEGWDLPDHDIAVIDVATLELSYVNSLMNICMSIAVNPKDGRISVVGTEGTNEVRFEPNVQGRFLRVRIALAGPGDGDTKDILDLNPHLEYAKATIGASEREQSIGDPRAIVWNSAGDRAYICGKGSNNVIAIDGGGARADGTSSIDVGEGPSGLFLAEESGLLYVLNHFSASITIVDTGLGSALEEVAFHDPTPAAIRTGRKHLYDTHKNSGLGQIACASCHVDARLDRLAWDLGDPAGDMKDFDQNCFEAPLGLCEGFHPMKGPMLTQTLQDIIGHEPFHWRGDRDGLEEFNPAFVNLQGAEQSLTSDEMQEFEDFLASIYFPPNPFRNKDNTLPTDLPLPGHYTTGRFDPAGEALPNGDAEEGLHLYRTANLDAGLLDCVACHTLPTGMGRDTEVVVAGFPPTLSLEPVEVGPNGEHHLAVTGQDLASGISMKVPQLRNLYKRVGFEATQLENLSGFGFLHDGSVDSIARFVGEPVFDVASDQEVADLVAFMLAFSGSDLPAGGESTPFEPLGPAGQDTHAAVGLQMTFDGTNTEGSPARDRFDLVRDLAEDDAVGLIAKGVIDGDARGFFYKKSGDVFQSDRLGDEYGWSTLLDLATKELPITITVVPKGTEVRLGVDRDEDAFYDLDEVDQCSDPEDAASVPGPTGCGELDIQFDRGDCNADGSFDLSDPIRALTRLFQDGPAFACDDSCDVNDDGDLNLVDPIYALNYLFQSGNDPAQPFGKCGLESSPDALTCGSYDACD